MHLSTETTKRPHTASVIVNVGEVAHFDVIFKPSAIQRSQAHVRLTVIDNQYEDSVVQMVGEGYQEEITLDNIHSIEQQIDPEYEEGSMAEDDISGMYIMLESVEIFTKLLTNNFPKFVVKIFVKTSAGLPSKYF